MPLYTFKYHPLDPESHPFVALYADSEGDARVATARWLNEVYEPAILYPPEALDLQEDMTWEENYISFAVKRSTLEGCPKCGKPFFCEGTEDNDPVTHAICKPCDITFSFDEFGFWAFDRLCTHGHPGILNVSNGLYGCLDVHCTEYMTDFLDPDDYTISGWRGKARPYDMEPEDWNGTTWEEIDEGGGQSPLKEYLVTWQIEVDALSPSLAALIAQNIQRDSRSTATVFEVRELVEGAECHKIDLQDE